MIAQVLLTMAVRSGAGNYIVNLSAEGIIDSVKWVWIGQYVAIFAIGFGKIAVIALLFRIQANRHALRSIFLHFIWASNTAINITQVALLVHQCDPPAKLWNNGLPGICDERIRAEYSGFFQGSWSAASDLALAIYPITIFWKLSVSWKRKIGLCVLMGGGIITCAVGIIKTIYIRLAPLTNDVTYSIYPLLIAAYTEMWLIVVFGSIPPLRLLFVHLHKRTRLVVSLSFLQFRNGREEGSSLQIEDINYAKHFLDRSKTKCRTVLPQNNYNGQHVQLESRETEDTNAVATTHYSVNHNEHEGAHEG